MIRIEQIFEDGVHNDFELTVNGVVIPITASEANDLSIELAQLLQDRAKAASSTLTA